MGYLQVLNLMIKAYKAARGVMPKGLDLLKLQQRARKKVIDSNKVVQFPKDRITNPFKPRPTKPEGTIPVTVKGKTSKMSPEGIMNMLMKQGKGKDVKIGQAPKTTKVKEPVDPKLAMQESTRELYKKLTRQNREAIRNFKKRNKDDPTKKADGGRIGFANGGDLERFRQAFNAAQDPQGLMDEATFDRLYGGRYEQLFNEYKANPGTFFSAGDDTQGMYDRFNAIYNQPTQYLPTTAQRELLKYTGSGLANQAALASIQRQGENKAALDILNQSMAPRTQSVPTQSVPTQSMSTESILTQYVTPQPMATQSVPTQSVPTQSLPPVPTNNPFQNSLGAPRTGIQSVPTTQLRNMQQPQMLPGPVGMQSLAQINAMRDQVLAAQMNESGQTFADGKYKNQAEAIADLGLERYNQLFSSGGRVNFNTGGGTSNVIGTYLSNPTLQDRYTQQQYEDLFGVGTAQPQTVSSLLQNQVQPTRVAAAPVVPNIIKPIIPIPQGDGDSGGGGITTVDLGEITADNYGFGVDDQTGMGYQLTEEDLKDIDDARFTSGLKNIGYDIKNFYTTVSPFLNIKKGFEKAKQFGLDTKARLDEEKRIREEYELSRRQAREVAKLRARAKAMGYEGDTRSKSESDFASSQTYGGGGSRGDMGADTFI